MQNKIIILSSQNQQLKDATAQQEEAMASLQADFKKANEELNRIKKCSILANKLNIEVHAGHGLDYKTTKILNKIKEIEEFNIGHFIIGESIFIGLLNVIKNFKKIIKN